MIVKYPDGAGESVLIAQEITPIEQLILKENPQLLKSPETILDILTLAQAEQAQQLDS